MEVRLYKAGDEVSRTGHLTWREPVADSFNTAYFARTFWHDDKPIAILGVNLFSLHVGIIFMVVSNDCIEVGKEFSEAVQDIINTRPQEHGIYKLYALVDSDSVVSRKWIERFGFLHEYTMKDAGNNHQDMYGYAWERRE